MAYFECDWDHNFVRIENIAEENILFHVDDIFKVMEYRIRLSEKFNIPLEELCISMKRAWLKKKNQTKEKPHYFMCVVHRDGALKRKYKSSYEGQELKDIIALSCPWVLDTKGGKKVDLNQFEVVRRTS